MERDEKVEFLTIYLLIYGKHMEGVDEGLMRIILYIQELKWAEEEGVSICSYAWNFVINKDNGVLEMLVWVSDLIYKNIHQH